uniref:Uncharacterized protein n=1 Tax=Physcomitrium patens TaxID=3218 RepID=A0A2K1KFA8_PHYPA|nr:hypothetical protein PHYPA_008813 [Physcomitrium patens]
MQILVGTMNVLPAAYIVEADDPGGTILISMLSLLQSIHLKHMLQPTLCASCEKQFDPGL